VQVRSLGDSAISIPVVGLGSSLTFDQAEAASPGSVRRLVDVALKKGIRLFDTSPMYGDAERLLADAMRGRRDDALICTKIWNENVETGKAHTLEVLDWFEGRIDILLVHNLVRWQDYTPWLHDLKSQGLVKAIGISHWELPAFPEVLVAIETGGFDCVELPYSIGARAIEKELLPAAAARNMGMIAHTPLANGRLLGGVAGALAQGSLTQFGVRTAAQAMLKWVLSDPRVTAVIPATSKQSRVGENVEAGSPPWLPDVERHRLVVALGSVAP